MNLIHANHEIRLVRLLGLLLISIFMAVALFASGVLAQDQALEWLRETGKAFAAVAKQTS